jgi:hypothetical protein
MIVTKYIIEILHNNNVKGIISNSILNDFHYSYIYNFKSIYNTSKSSIITRDNHSVRMILIIPK